MGTHSIYTQKAPIQTITADSKTKHLVSADVSTIRLIIEGTLAQAKNRSSAVALLLQAVDSLSRFPSVFTDGHQLADILRHCVENAVPFLLDDYWPSLAALSAFARNANPHISQPARALLPPLLTRLSEEKQKPSEGLFTFATVNLAALGASNIDHSSAGTLASVNMGLAEQFLSANSHMSTADIISNYAKQQRQTTAQPDGLNNAADSGDDKRQQSVLGVDDVAKAIAVIASNYGEEFKCDANSFAATINNYNSGISWEEVIYKLPYSNLHVKDESGAMFIIKVFLAATAGQNRPFPYSLMYEIWPDAPAQVSFLRNMLRSQAAAPYLLDKHMPTVTTDPLDLLYKVYQPEFTRILASPWNSLSLILVLSHLLDSKASDEARALLEAGIAQEPLLVTLALARLKIQHPRLQALLQHNVARFLKREFSHYGLFFELFRICERKMMLAFFCNIHRKDSSFSRYILDVLVDLGMANELLLVPKRDDIMMLDFIVEMAVFASRRGILVFDTWFPGLLTELGSDMLHASLEILHSKLQLEAARQRGEDKGIAAYSSAELTVMFKALGVVSMSPNNTANLKALYAQFVELTAELERTENERSIEEGQIEKEAESLFLRLYRGELSVEQMADTLEELRDSLRVFMRKTYAHVIQYPLEEFSFFDNYPEKELTITGQLVGTLIQRHMLSPASEPAILEMLVKALQSPTSSKSFNFGMTALQACLYRIEQLPVFCTTLYQIPVFQQHQQQNSTSAVKLVQSIINSAMPTRSAQTSAEQARLGATPDLMGNRLGVFGAGGIAETQQVFQSIVPPPLPELGEASAAPVEETRDKIQFAMNNLARNNLSEKMAEVDKVLQPKHFEWFSQDIVVNRASQEPNYHALYLQFVEALERPLLIKCILRETLSSIYRLLNAESTVNSSRDRSYLKNLGAWLGGMTLARDQPILRENVSFKDLLCEGYSCNRLIVAIPFVCKVLEQAARSTVFHPPNPWLMSIMGVLAELYATANLKLNLTFEIEVLCKALDLDVKAITPTAILGRAPARNAIDALATDLSKATVGADKAPLINTEAVQMPVITGADITVDIMGVLTQHASFHAAESVFSQPTMKKIFYMLTERMIREIIPIHVARSIYVAVSCTRDTIQKDFCGEPNEEHVHRAAQVMARGLAGALAVSLCRDQLKSQLYQTMRVFLIRHSLAEQTANSVAVGLVADNLDLACAIAEKEAIERASQQIDAVLNEAYVARKRTRERTGQPFYDLGQYGRLMYPAEFPEVLKVRLNGLQAGHLRIYEDFTQIPHFFSQIGNVNEEEELGVAQSLEQFVQIMGELERIIAAAGIDVTLSQLPAQHEACLYARDILVRAARVAQMDDAVLDMAQALVSSLYRAETRLGVDLYVLLLARVCEMSARVAREVTSWLAYADDARKYNVAATLALINEGLISAEDEDELLARQIDAGRAGAAEFASRLLRRAGRDAFSRTAQSLARATQGGQQAGYRQMLLSWTRVYEHPAAGDTELETLVQQLQQQVALKDTGVAAAFFRAGVEAAVAGFEGALPGTERGGFQVADALVRLVVCLARSGEGLQPARMFVSSVALVAVHMHATRPETFGAYQRVIFRLLVGLLNEAHTAHRSGDSALEGTEALLAETLLLLAPTHVPGLAFVWLQLAAHRYLLPQLVSSRAGWEQAASLLETQLRFIQPFVERGLVGEGVKLLYRGTVCVVLVVLHDYPEFLAAHALRLSDAVPVGCVQLRNLLLSAYPRAMRLPEPLTPNLKIDLLPEISQTPEIPYDHTAPLPQGLREELDKFMGTQKPEDFAASVLDRIRTEDAGYDVAAVNAFVLHALVRMAQADEGSAQEEAQRVVLDLLREVLDKADAEGRYLVANAVANQLRFPSAHTYLASRLVLALFAKSTEPVRECISRVLVERILVNRPFPWGLLVTLIELLRNPYYAFWTHDFTRASPQIADILAAVAKSVHPTEAAAAPPPAATQAQ
ncbi:CCR4-NOT core subunit cdc39 [Coemansia sp. RSA 1085]|nr:CCR4-NOT core subunit cdc39 [Coemansia sp. RSA 1085]